MKNTVSAKRPSSSGILALLLAAIIFGSMHLLANTVKNSGVYRQSRVISLLISQDSVGLGGMVTDTRNLPTLLKFTGALTSAYIDFELIPLNEINTFAVVWESMPEGLEIERFRYRGHNLSIYGVAPTRASYREFVTALRGHNYFDSVSEQSYLTTDDTVRFELECAVSG